MIAMRTAVKHFTVFVASLVTLAIVGGLGWFVIHGYTFSPEDVEFVYEDLVRWESTISTLPSDRGQWKQILEDQYLRPGSRGLGSYRQGQGLTPDGLGRMLGEDADLWKSCRLNYHVKNIEPEVRTALQGLKRLYPRAMFAPVTYVVGGERAGGSNGPNGVVIAVELYRSDLMGCLAQASYLHRSTELPCLIVHEFVHFNQAANSPLTYLRRWDLLARAIKEGSADFITELSVGCHTNAHGHAWASGRQAELWRQFRTDLGSGAEGEWFYVLPQDGRPQDLGYVVGYHIVRAFYERAVDKAAAIRAIMSIKDYDAFLARSGYDELAP